MGARALEVVGDRWSLLIVRDLLPGPRRFTDLVRSLSPITPTRLTDRLRRLEAAEVVEREPAESGNEVWYRLTDAGRDLGPAVSELAFWGIEHAKEPPRADEPVPGEAAMLGTKVWLNRYSAAPPTGWSGSGASAVRTATAYAPRTAPGTSLAARRTVPRLRWRRARKTGPCS